MTGNFKTINADSKCAALGTAFLLWNLSSTANAQVQQLAADHPLVQALSADVWRTEHRIIDVHQHIENKPERLARAIQILDAAGVGTGVLLGAGTVSKKGDQPSDFQAVKDQADRLHPGRFMCHMLLDYTGWDDASWSERAVKQIDEGFRLGAAGLKEFKRLGLVLKDAKGELIRIDDEKLDPVWSRCGELDMPVSIHVGDPAAFWLPYDSSNERWTELRDHKSWWFGDAKLYPPRMDLLNALNRVIARHPKTKFVCVHFANNPEDLKWVEDALDRYPNMYADMAARIPELGRHEPEQVRKLFEKHQDRILFATDFMVYNKYILGSGGDSENPTDEQAVEFFMKCYRWLETDDRNWAHMTPIQGDWTISSIHLPTKVCRKIYFDNAQRIFARSIPLPTLHASKLETDFLPDGNLDEAEWKKAAPLRLEYESQNGMARPELSTPVKALWSDKYLYLSYECPYREINVFSPKVSQERLGLWDNDVVEAFIGSEPEAINRYTEFEFSPSGEYLDLKLDLPAKDFEWTAAPDSSVVIDESAKVWRVETRIPLAALAKHAPQVGDRWKINLYRHDRADNAFMAMSPTLRGSFHTPARFGWLQFD